MMAPTVKFCRPMLGAFVQIEIRDSRFSEHALNQLAEFAYGRLARVQYLMGSNDQTSELSRLNACGFLHPMSVNPWTREVLTEVKRLAEASEGVFDIVIEQSSQPSLKNQPLIRSRDESVTASYRDIILHDDGRVSFLQPLTLQVDAVVRSFAIDKAAEVLREAGVNCASIRVGEDLCFIGKRPKLLPLRDPTSTGDQRLGAHITAAAVATRAAYFANRRYHWRKQNYILHPVSQKPMRSNVSLSVFAETCLQAEALSRVVLVDEPASWQALLKRHRASAVFVTAKGEMVPFAAALTP